MGLSKRRLIVGFFILTFCGLYVASWCWLYPEEFNMTNLFTWWKNI